MWTGFFCIRIGEFEAVVKKVTKLWVSQDVENSLLSQELLVTQKGLHFMEIFIHLFRDLLKIPQRNRI